MEILFIICSLAVWVRIMSDSEVDPLPGEAGHGLVGQPEPKSSPQGAQRRSSRLALRSSSPPDDRATLLAQLADRGLPLSQLQELIGLTASSNWVEPQPAAEKSEESRLVSSTTGEEESGYVAYACSTSDSWLIHCRQRSSHYPAVPAEFYAHH